MSMIVPVNRTVRASQRGVMLLEALVSIAIFSIGVLGLIGLQSAAIKNANDARQRAAAAFYANQIVGQMWSDASNLASYQHNPGGHPSTDACSFTGEASANAQVTGWVDAVKRDLAGAAVAGRQQITVGAGNVINVTLCWKNPEEAVFHWFTAVAQIQGP